MYVSAMYLSANVLQLRQRVPALVKRVLEKSDLSSNKDLYLKPVCNPCTRIPIVSTSSDTVLDLWSTTLGLDFLSATKIKKKKNYFVMQNYYFFFFIRRYDKFVLEHIIRFRNLPRFCQILVRTSGARCSIKLPSLANIACCMCDSWFKTKKYLLRM